MVYSCPNKECVYLFDFPDYTGNQYFKIPVCPYCGTRLNPKIEQPNRQVRKMSDKDGMLYIVQDGNGEKVFGVYSEIAYADWGKAKLNRILKFYNMNLFVKQIELDSDDTIDEILERYKDWERTPISKAGEKLPDYYLYCELHKKYEDVSNDLPLYRQVINSNTSYACGDKENVK